MRRLLLGATLALVACGSVPSRGPDPAADVAPIPKPLADLVVVYAGDAGSPETESWRAFLVQHVASVRVIDVLDLARADLAGADALIVGGSPLQGTGRSARILPAPQGITLDVLPLPIVLIGGKGGQVADQMNLKLGWRHG